MGGEFGGGVAEASVDVGQAVSGEVFGGFEDEVDAQIGEGHEFGEGGGASVGLVNPQVEELEGFGVEVGEGVHGDGGQGTGQS